MSEELLKRWQAKINRKHRTYHDNVIRLLTFEGLTDRLADVGREYDAVIAGERAYGRFVKVPSFASYGLISEANLWQSAYRANIEDDELHSSAREGRAIRVVLDGYSPNFRRYIFREIPPRE